MTIHAGGLPTLIFMALADLTILNRNTSGVPRRRLLPDACVVGTCLREVRIGMASPDDQPMPAEARAAGYELYTGARRLIAFCCSWPADWRARSRVKPKSSAR